MTSSPIILTIFGITGNLSTHKLLPALYHLVKGNHLPEKFVIIGAFRNETEGNTKSIMQEAELQLLRDHVDVDQIALEKLKKMIQPIQMDSTNAADFKRLSEKLAEIGAAGQVKYHHLFYLAIPPQIFRNAVGCLASAGLHTSNVLNNGISRILVEKPFGDDLASAKDLIAYMGQYFHDDQIYRIDHYLAKETAQNILAFRFNNPMIEGMWSRQFIDHIQITAGETIGIQGRTAFYENIGALRDIVQSHVLQLMALIMMEDPIEMQSANVHKEKLELMRAIQPIAPNHVEESVVRGQYRGYKEEVNNPESLVETYVALSLEVGNSRWGGVPVLLRTGKALASKSTQITAVFRDHTRRAIPANLLTIRIQPDEGISVKLLAKRPGFVDELQPVNMEFHYTDSFGYMQPDAYQRVLVDTMRGDQTLFATGDEVITSWQLLQPVLDYWKNNKTPPEQYELGSWGPQAADALAKRYGCEWLT